MLIDVLIVDDEEIACANLKKLLQEYGHEAIRIVGVAYNTREAEQLIGKLKPHAIFVDVDMPRENAFQFLQRIGPIDFEIVFVTAYDQYAIKAFRLNAVDYILKPIDIDELKNATAKLVEKISLKRTISDTSYLELYEQISKKADSRKIRLSSTNHSFLVDFNDIYFIEAQGSYSRIVFTDGHATQEIIMSNPSSDYEDLLPSNMYYRIHKTYLINCLHISKFISEHTYFVLIKNEFRLPVSRRRFQPLKNFLKSNGHLL